jgi:hypothetical protein
MSVDIPDNETKYYEFVESFKIFDKMYLKLKGKLGRLNDQYVQNILDEHFINTDDEEFMEIFFATHSIAERYANLPKQEKLCPTKSNEKFARKYNSSITNFRKYLSEKSLLNGINYINIVTDTDIIICSGTLDILTSEEICYGDKCLQLSHDGLIKYEDESYFLNCLKTYISNCTINDVYVQENCGKLQLSKYNPSRNTIDQLTLKINFPNFQKLESGKTIYHHIYSNDDQISKLFFRNNYRYLRPNPFSDYHDYVSNKIRQLISSQWKVHNTLKYISCINCHHDNIIKDTNVYACVCCRFEMCGHGCGKIGHGRLSCDADPMLMNAILMKKYVNSQCPSCSQFLEKIEGCNHMTCICKAQFCNQCGHEYEYDQHGHYLISEHYSNDSDDDYDSDEGEDARNHRQNRILIRNRTKVKKCGQYDPTSKIVIPTINQLRKILIKKEQRK